MRSNLAYDDPRREELLDGKVVAMSPRPAFNHNRAASNIYRIFANFLHRQTCTPIADGTDLYLTDRDRFVPDFMVVCDRSKIKWDGVHGAPDLVAEVLSPGTGQYDRGHKMETYARCGVQEYWIVDIANRSVEQYRPREGGFGLQMIYTLHPDYVLEAMTEEERAAVATVFQCSLFSELDISLEDIFDGLLE